MKLRELLSISVLVLSSMNLFGQSAVSCSKFYVTPQFGISHRLGNGEYHGRFVGDKAELSYGLNLGFAKQFGNYKGLLSIGYEKLSIGSAEEQLFPGKIDHPKESLNPEKPYYGDLIIPESNSYFESFNADFQYVNLSIGGQTKLTEFVALEVSIKPAFLVGYREQIVRESESLSQVHSTTDRSIRDIQSFNIFSNIGVAYLLRTEKKTADFGVYMNNSWLSVLKNDQNPNIFPMSAGIFVRSYL